MRCGLWVAVLTVATLAGCDSGLGTSASTAQPEPDSSAAPLFYTKDGSLYVSRPAGAPGRRITDGGQDWQPAPSPDLSRVAFVRKAADSDYGGELWVLDLSADLTAAGPPRRLVDPAELPDGGDMVATPRWSPTGEHLAFVANPTNGTVDGGYLSVAEADSGEPVTSGRLQWAEDGFAWAPDGRRIAWIDARSDVSPVNVNVLTVGSGSTTVATGTNALSVAFGPGATEVLFTNGQASFPDDAGNPFTLAAGGIYSVAVEPGQEASPVALLSRPGSSFTDIAVLESGAVAFTDRTEYSAPKSVEILDEGSTQARTTVTGAATTVWQTMTPAQAPGWGPGDMLAYLDTSLGTALVVTDSTTNDPRRVDTGVDTFGWPPRP